MKIKFVNNLTLVVLLMSSCTSRLPYYQVYKITPGEKITAQTNALVYEDQFCKITYNLWSEGGDIGFIFHNKTDSNIYINKDKCYFILNGFAHDYFKDRIYTKTVSSSYAISSSKSASQSQTGVNIYDYVQSNQLNEGLSSGSGKSVGYQVSFNEPTIICVPAKTSKRLDEYKILDSPYRHCDLTRYPYDKSKISLQFSKENSPFVFGNKLVFTVGTNAQINTVNNEFYISEITNYSDNGFFAFRTSVYCEEKSYTKKKYPKFESKDSFYISYPFYENSFKH